jgi:hypothetical protein
MNLNFACSIVWQRKHELSSCDRNRFSNKELRKMFGPEKGDKEVAGG